MEPRNYRHHRDRARTSGWINRVFKQKKDWGSAQWDEKMAKITRYHWVQLIRWPSNCWTNSCHLCQAISVCVRSFTLQTCSATCSCCSGSSACSLKRGLHPRHSGYWVHVRWKPAGEHAWHWLNARRSWWGGKLCQTEDYFQPSTKLKAAFLF